MISQFFMDRAGAAPAVLPAAVPVSVPVPGFAAARPAIELHNLTVGYERHPAVHHLSLRWAAGSLVAIVGPNGAGKSTLLKALAAELRPLSGRIEGLVGRRVAYLPQAPQIDRSFPVTVQDLVQFGLWHQVGALGRWKGAHRQRCREALATVGLQGFESRTIDTLSGGQFQRALFARLMLQDADLLLLDEPFAAVDESTSADLLQLLKNWSASGKTVLTVLHDLRLVRTHFPQALLLAREPIAHGATAAVLTPANLRRALGMREAFDDLAPWCEADAAAPLGTPAHAHEHAPGHTLHQAGGRS
ncbi:MAG: zinc ABC transporter ATP-binding protein AztA [Serpentinimonas sp.]|nr:zinc ABC transporter ATP-binding protein AztA [Serpentinimonas sp.]MDO9611441.1 zinc ABC transporter ATP-binding protein AztA [Serpentinimonas sp.]